MDKTEHLQMQVGYLATALMVRGDSRSLPEIVKEATEATAPNRVIGKEEIERMAKRLEDESTGPYDLRFTAAELFRRVIECM